MAQAIRGKFVGSEVAYNRGDIRRVRIVSVQPAQTESRAADGAERRQAVLKQALEAAARTNAEMFAASFNGKWGDYDLDDGVDLSDAPNLHLDST